MSKKNKKIFSEMSPIGRRSFINYAKAALAAPAVSEILRYSFFDSIGGDALAVEMSQKPRYFLEVNFRDQWDFASVFLPEGLGANYDSIPKEGGRGAAIYGRPERAPGSNLYVTPEASEIIPHVENIAVIETGEGGKGGIHWHEAANAMRSPGRTRDNKSGFKDMATVDKRPKVGGNEVYYSRTPTPAVFLNWYQKNKLGFNPNGVLLRSQPRQIHTYYHFEAGLRNAQLDRFFNEESFMEAYGKQREVMVRDFSLFEKNQKQLAEILKNVDSLHFKRLIADQERIKEHVQYLSRIENKGSSGPQSKIFSARMSDEEKKYWTQGIPATLKCSGDNSSACEEKDGTMNAGMMFGQVANLFSNDIIRTAAIDFEMHDVHDVRTEFVLNTQAKQTAKPLARFIEKIKEAGIWDQTVIAMYTLDNSRGVEKDSTGEDGKNGLILAGGNIKGGYYGDIRYKDNQWTYHRPDASGKPVQNGDNLKDTYRGRVPGRDIYKTVAKAAGVDEPTLNEMEDVKEGETLQYLFNKPV